MAFNPANPPFNTLLVSADIRANWDAIQASIGAVSWLQDPLFECWPVNDTTIPGTWNLSGAGALVARDTTPTRIAYGTMGPRITFGAAAAIVFQDLVVGADFLQYFDGKVFSFGAFINADTIGIAQIFVDDGVTSTPSGTNPNANPGVPDYLEVEHVVNAAATRIRVEARINGAGAGTWSAASALFADMRPALGRFVHPVTLPISLSGFRSGVNAVVNLQSVKRIQRPFVAEYATVDVLPGPVGGSDVFNWLKPDGAGGFIVMMAPGPTLLAGELGGVSSSFANHNARCFVPNLTNFSVIPVGSRVQPQISAVAPTPAQNSTMELFGHGWARPQELIIKGINGLK